MRPSERGHCVPHNIGLLVRRAVVNRARIPPRYPASPRLAERLHLERQRMVGVEVNLVPPGTFTTNVILGSGVRPRLASVIEPCGDSGHVVLQASGGFCQPAKFII